MIQGRTTAEKRAAKALDQLGQTIESLRFALKALPDEPDHPDLKLRNKLRWVAKNLTQEFSRLETMVGHLPEGGEEE
jgi:hypothetical protein